MLPSRHGYFNPILILPVKMVKLPQQRANTTVHWLWTLPLPIVAKSSILNVLLDLSLKMLPCMKTSAVSCENQSFSHYFKMLPPFSKVIVVFFCYFLQYAEVFFISLLDGCYHYLISWIQSMVVQSQNYL